jgi:hypothetical protein
MCARRLHGHHPPFPDPPQLHLWTPSTSPYTYPHCCCDTETPARRRCWLRAAAACTGTGQPCVHLDRPSDAFPRSFIQVVRSPPAPRQNQALPRVPFVGRSHKPGPLHKAQWPQLSCSKPLPRSAPNATPSKSRNSSRRLGEWVYNRSSTAKPASPAACRPPRCTCSISLASGPGDAAWPGAPTAPQGSSAPLRLLVWAFRTSVHTPRLLNASHSGCKSHCY